MNLNASGKASLLLRLSALGAKDSDLAAVREALFNNNANNTRPSGVFTTAGGDSLTSGSFTASLRSPSGSTLGTPLAAQRFNTNRDASINTELMSFLTREFSGQVVTDAYVPEGAHLDRVPLSHSGQGQQSGSNTSEEESKLSEEMVRLLDSWFEFDIFDFARTSDKEGGVLVNMGELLFDRHGFRDRYRISATVLRSFLANLQAAYVVDLPYHNAIHAADVAQSMSHFIVKCGLGQKGDELMRFAAIVAALGHDTGHPGYTNRYLIETRSPLALTYNDKSPLENMHASKLFSIMWGRSDGKCDITSQMDRVREVPRFRRMVIEMILATDNGLHERVLEKIQLESHDDEGVFQAAMHAADLGGGAKTVPLAHQWANRVLQEFFRQGDAERVLNLYPVLPVMDRHNPMPKGVFQEGFIKKICLPVYTALNTVPGIDLSVQVNALEDMARHWVAHTSAPVATKLRGTKSFTLFQRSANRDQPHHQQKAAEVDCTTDVAASNPFSTFRFSRRQSSSSGTAPSSSSRVDSHRAGTQEDVITSDEDDAEEANVEVLSDDSAFPARYPIVRSKSTDAITTMSKDIRQRLNLSPRTFLFGGLDGPRRISSVGGDPSPPTIAHPPRSDVVRDAVQRARASRGPSPPMTDVVVATDAALPVIPFPAPTTSATPSSSSSHWRPPISPKSFRPPTQSMTSASTPMMNAAEATISAARQSERKAAQREEEVRKSPSRRKRHSSANRRGSHNTSKGS